MPEAMALATVSADGMPSVRMVIARGLPGGLLVFTDYTSEKGAALLARPVAAGVLHWHVPLHRQVRIVGRATRVADEEADAYWSSRTPGAQAAMAGSHQSGPRHVGSVGGGAVERPARWGGFRIEPEVVEFWEESPDGLHARVRHRLVDGGWLVEELDP
jgi:pyridoxamine 5'-phosphate oxidase